MAVYFFYGEEDYNIDLEIESMRSKLNPDFSAMNYQVMDNPSYSDLINALRTPPMMFGDMLYVINSEKYFISKKKSDDSESSSSFDDSELADIEDALINNPNGLNIVFVVKLPRNEQKKIDSRRKLFKILNKFTAKEFPVFKSYKVQEIVYWVKQRAKNKGLMLKDDAAELLVEQIGNELRQFDVELDKLQLVAYPEKNITKQMVSEVAITNQDLFNITDYIMNNRNDEALLEFRKLTDKKHPLEILSAIQTMLRKWIIIKTKSTIPTSELAKLTGMSEFAVKPMMLKLKNTSIADLVKLKQNLYEAECKIKTGNGENPIEEVEFAIIR